MDGCCGPLHLPLGFPGLENQLAALHSRTKKHRRHLNSALGTNQPHKRGASQEGLRGPARTAGLVTRVHDPVG